MPCVYMEKRSIIAVSKREIKKRLHCRLVIAHCLLDIVSKRIAFESIRSIGLHKEIDFEDGVEIVSISCPTFIRELCEKEMEMKSYVDSIIFACRQPLVPCRRHHPTSPVSI